MSDRIGLRMAHGLQTSAIVGARHAVPDTTANIYLFSNPPQRSGGGGSKQHDLCFVLRNGARVVAYHPSPYPQSKSYRYHKGELQWPTILFQ